MNRFLHLRHHFISTSTWKRLEIDRDFYEMDVMEMLEHTPYSKRKAKFVNNMNLQPLADHMSYKWDIDAVMHFSNLTMKSLKYSDDVWIGSSAFSTVTERRLILTTAALDIVNVSIPVAPGSDFKTFDIYVPLNPRDILYV